MIKFEFEDILQWFKDKVKVKEEAYYAAGIGASCRYGCQKPQDDEVILPKYPGFQYGFFRI
jgi:hypothetical protein